MVALMLRGLPFAHAGALAGPVIGSIEWDAATYQPGRKPEMTVILKRHDFSGTISTTLSDENGIDLPSPTAQEVRAGNVNSTVKFTFRPPSRDFHGYHVTIEARDMHGNLVDDASGAFDIATDWKRFPRYCFVTGSSTSAGYDVTAVVNNLASYRCNAIQWYDVNWKHHEPYSNDSSWPNIGGQYIDRATLIAGLRRSHFLGMMNFNYELWNGAWSGYAADGSGVKAEWGLYKRRCLPHCTEATQVGHGPFPANWATPRLLQMDATNPAWQSYWLGEEQKVLEHFPYDGIQIDTLGDPGSAANARGEPVDLRRAIRPFIARTAAFLHTRVIFNAVSQWGLNELLHDKKVDVVYTELHPEFGDVEFFPALNGLAETIRRHTARSIVVAAYDEGGLAHQQGCHTTGGTRICTFDPTGVRFLDAQAMASGLNHWELGDLNVQCPVRQAKLASDIYIPGPALCMDAPLQEWEQDAHNFAVSYETWLRDGSRDAVGLTPKISGLPEGMAASTTGAAGTVYVLSKRHGSSIIIHLLNYASLSSIRIDDPDGTDKPARQMNNLTVTVPGEGLGQPQIWWATPDARHGQAQPVSYRCMDGAVVFTIPSLDVWDMIVLQHNHKSNSDVLEKSCFSGR